MPFLVTRTWVAVLPLVWVVAGCGGPGPDPVVAPTVPSDGPASVLRDWDVAREAAWAAGDPVALGALYVAGAQAGRRDVRLLASYAARGLRVTGLRFQRLAARVLVDDGAVLRLDVVERLMSATVHGSAGVRRLPAGQPVRRLIELRRVQGAWRVARVTSRWR